MFSSFPTSNRFLSSPCAAAPSLNLPPPPFPSLALALAVAETGGRRGPRRQALVASLRNLPPSALREAKFLGLFRAGGGPRGQDRRCWCWGGCDREGDLGLEAALLEFMIKSENPAAFPTKKQLVDAGRMDLVEAVFRQGGWLSWGWDSEIENVTAAGGDGEVLNEEEVYREAAVVSSSSSNSSHLAASSSGRSLESTSDVDMGIEGILSRLEEERNTSLGHALKETLSSSPSSAQAAIDDYDLQMQPAPPDKVAILERTISQTPKRPNKSIPKDSFYDLHENGSLSRNSGLNDTGKPEMWRTWSIQRAGNSTSDFEVGEISFSKSRTKDFRNASKDDIASITQSSIDSVDRMKESDSWGTGQIHSRLLQLESELSSALCSLRSKAGEIVPLEGHDSSSDSLCELSDAWEFQENEIMTVKDSIRSIRAKLAVLEGKMALAIIEAQKTVEEKQKKIDYARKALTLLRPVSIVWPNAASEVLLAGSYDGWTTQRKMERSSTGVFSLGLKLYPGKYEIKFIVDGNWRIDPLRPIVQNNGYENNLLIVT